MGEEPTQRRSFGRVTLSVVASLAFVAGAAFGGMFLGQQPQEPELAPRPSVSSTASGDLDLGATATSPLGNRITALEWRPSVKVQGKPYARAEVEWCAGPGQSGQISEVVPLWSVEMQDSSRVAVAPVPADSSSLAASSSLVVGAGECARGFLDFEVPPGKVPKRLVFSGQGAYSWMLPGPGS